jgi:hypothetical protein
MIPQMTNKERELWNSLDFDKVKGWSVEFLQDEGVKVITIHFTDDTTKTYKVRFGDEDFLQEQKDNFKRFI